MKIKNQKGITLTMLVVTIIILIILTSTTVYVGTNIIDRTNLQNLNTNMLLIQAKVKTIGENSKFNKDEAQLKGKKVSEITDNEKITKLIQEGIVEASDKYYLLSQEDLEQMGLEKIQIEEGFLVNYEAEEIIYVKGFKVDQTYHYKLSDTKNLVIK